MFSWTIRTKQEKGVSWYVTAIIVALALIIWGFVMDLYALSIVVFIFAGVYLLIENNTPDTIGVLVNENGINVGGQFYDYPKIESFGIIYTNGEPILLRLKLRSKGFKHLDVDLDRSLNTADLRAFLAQYAEEDENADLSSSEQLMRQLKI